MSWGICNPQQLEFLMNMVTGQKNEKYGDEILWLLDGATKILFNFKNHPGNENLADYPSKSHSGTRHLAVHPFYMHPPTSPRFLHRAAKPSVQQGCINKVGPTYIFKPSGPYHKHVDCTLKPIPELVIPCHNVHEHGTKVGSIPQSMPNKFGAQTLLIILLSLS